jgi:hypothetical protein
MLEVIGILAAWIFGGVAAFYAPILTCGWWARTGDGLSDLAFGLMMSWLFLAVYVIITVVYFVAT